MAKFWDVFPRELYSSEILQLTTDILDMNEGHYTVWTFRRKVITQLGLDLRAELEWAREFSRANPKNYQVWHHRQCLISLVGEESGELAEMIGDFQQEPKNYHAWQYRQWLVGRFHADEAGELRLVDELIRIDPYNNSAYNHRYFVLFGTGRRGGRSEAWWAEELCWAEAKLGLDASNPSAQLYLEAIQALRQQKLEAVDA